MSAPDTSPEARPPNGERRRWTLADVAAAAGVSPSTVSRVMRGSPQVNEAMRARVLEAATRVGFAPDQAARALVTGSSPFVGMIVPDVGEIFYAQTLKGARDVLEEHGLQVLLMESAHDAQKETAAIHALRAHRVSGILLATFGGYEPANVPLVFFDHVLADVGEGEVALADHEAAGDLVDHLLTHGHKRIAYIGGPRGFSPAEERRDGFVAALAKHWLAVPQEYMQTSDVMLSEAASARATSLLLGLDPAPTAIVAGSNRLAIGALRTLRAAGKRVPEDMALVCFGDSDSGDLMDPPLTVVSHRPRELGRRAAAILLGQIEHPGPRIKDRLPVELIVRRSCGCP
jgi:LacI family transcriptional regulator